jgi:hypothetical protein
MSWSHDAPSSVPGTSGLLEVIPGPVDAAPWLVDLIRGPVCGISCPVDKTWPNGGEPLTTLHSSPPPLRVENARRNMACDMASVISKS